MVAKSYIRSRLETNFRYTVYLVEKTIWELVCLQCVAQSPASLIAGRRQSGSSLQGSLNGQTSSVSPESSHRLAKSAAPGIFPSSILAKWQCYLCNPCLIHNSTPNRLAGWKRVMKALCQHVIWVNAPTCSVLAAGLVDQNRGQGPFKPGSRQKFPQLSSSAPVTQPLISRAPPAAPRLGVVPSSEGHGAGSVSSSLPAMGHIPEERAASKEREPRASDEDTAERSDADYIYRTGRR